MASAFGVNGLLPRTAVVVELRHAVLQIVKPGIGFGRGFLCALVLGLQIAQLCLVGRGQRVLVRAQFFAAQCQLPGLVFDVALVRRQHLDLLLHLHDGSALRIGFGLRTLLRIFKLGQARAVVLQLRGQRDGLLFGGHTLVSQRLDLGRRIVAARAPLADLFTQLNQPLLYPLTTFDHEANLAFEPAHFGACFIELALCLVDLVACGVMRLPYGFELGLDVPQVGHARFEIVHCLGGIGLDLGLVGLALGALQKPQLLLLFGGITLQLVVARSDLGLFLKSFEIGVEFAQDVFDARQVFARVTQAVFGFATAFLVLGDAGRFFKKQAQFFRLGFDDPADRALADDRVGTRAEAGAEEHVLHIAPAHWLVVDVVAAGAVARQHALDRDLGELRPLAASAMVGVVEHQLHARAAGLLASRRAVENHVLHRLATQLRGTRFAEHPAHRVHDVRLAATVGTDNADELAGQQKIGGFGERLEA